MENRTVEIESADARGLSRLIEALQQHAKTCETASQDSTEESLTGEASLREKNEQDARMWRTKAQVWQEAVEVARGFVPSTGTASVNSRLPSP